MKLPRLVATLFLGMPAVVAVPGFAQQSPAPSSPAVPSARVTTPSAHVGQAHLYYHQHNYSSAIKVLDTANAQLFGPGLKTTAAKQNLPAADPHRAQSLLEIGNLRQQIADQTKSDAELQKALSEYQLVTNIGDPRQQAAAQIQSAAAYMRLNQPAAALRSLEEADWTQFDRSQHFLLNYNLGRALDATRSPDQAARSYLKCLDANPLFAPAADRLAELTLNNSLSSTSARDVARELTERGYYRPAQALALNFIRQATTSEDESDGLALLLTAWSADYTDPREFEPQFRQAREVVRFHQPIVEDCWHIASATIPLELESLQTGQHSQLNSFRELEGNYRLENLKFALSDFIRSVGDSFAGLKQVSRPLPLERDLSQALSRYLIAWGLDHANSQAAQRIAWTLQAYQDLTPESRALIDRVAGPELHQRLVEQLFADKGRLYQTPEKKAQDWQNILQFHLLLGSIFEQQRIFKSDTWPQNAIDQWKLALEAEHRAREFTPGDTVDFRAPGLHEHLAKAYVSSDQPAEAFTHWLDAAEAYLSLDDIESAERMLENAQQFGHLPTGAGRLELVRSKAAIVKARLADGGSPQSPVPDRQE